MAKMLYFSLMSVVIIEIALWFFAGIGYNDNGSSHSSLFSALVSTTNDGTTGPLSVATGTNGFYIIMIAILAVSAAALIIPGFLASSNQWVLFAIGCGLLITYVGVIVQLWSFLHNALISIASVSSFAGLIASMITSPLILLYLSSIVEWSRFNY